MNTPKLKDGEIHVATLSIPGEQPYHLILLPDHPPERMTHQAASEWAASIGGDLPNRYEQALLFAYQRDQFDQDWYWSASRRESSSNHAWCQDFDYGNQGVNYSSSELRALAVLREYF